MSFTHIGESSTHDGLARGFCSVTGAKEIEGGGVLLVIPRGGAGPLSIEVPWWQIAIKPLARCISALANAGSPALTDLFEVG